MIFRTVSVKYFPIQKRAHLLGAFLNYYLLVVFELYVWFTLSLPFSLRVLTSTSV